MDMNTAFDLEVKQHCPQAEVVYDLFHVVARYGRDVIDRIRVDQANALSHDKPARKVVKQSRWLLLRNRDNLKDEQAVQLQELLAANQPLATVCVLKDALKEIWYAPSVREGWQRWRTWLRHARDSDLAPLQRFPKPQTLRPRHPRQRPLPQRLSRSFVITTTLPSRLSTKRQPSSIGKAYAWICPRPRFSIQSE
jgi:hypothetical protein